MKDRISHPWTSAVRLGASILGIVHDHSHYDHSEDCFRSILIVPSRFPIARHSDEHFSESLAGYIERALRDLLDAGMRMVQYYIRKVPTQPSPETGNLYQKFDLIVKICCRNTANKVISTIDLIDSSTEYLVHSYKSIQPKGTPLDLEELYRPVVESICRACRIPNAHFDEGMISSLRLQPA